MHEAVTALALTVDSGTPVIGMGPNCMATLRSDAVELTATQEAKIAFDGLLTFAGLTN